MSCCDICSVLTLRRGIQTLHTSPHWKDNAQNCRSGTSCARSWPRQSIEELVLVRGGMFRSHGWNQKSIFFWFGHCSLTVLCFWTEDVRNANCAANCVRKLRRGSAAVEERVFAFQALQKNKKKSVKVEETQGKHAWLPKI